MEISLIIALIIGGVNLIILIYLFFKLNSQPLLSELDEDIDDIYKNIEKIENDLEVYIADIYDKVEGVLKPINKRLATRATREEEKDLNSTETIKETGMISIQEAKKRGFIK